MNKKVKTELKISPALALKTVGLQTAGLLTGLILMFLFAQYGSLIKFQ